MRTMFASALMVALSTEALFAQAKATLRIAVALNKPGSGGTVRVALCPDQDAYDSERGCMLHSVAAKGGTVVVTFNGLVPGNWAVKVFHDQNDNGVLDTDWLGL